MALSLALPSRSVALGGGGREAADLAVAVAFSRKTRIFPETSYTDSNFCAFARTGLHGRPSCEKGKETGRRIIITALDHLFPTEREGEESGKWAESRDGVRADAGE